MADIISYNKRLEALRSERSSYIPLWGELSDYHLAHRGRFLLSDRNKGHKRNTKQYNNTSRLAVRTLASGMMSGITSPARPWFKLGISDLDLLEYAPVNDWLKSVQDIMYRVFAASNFYNSLHALYAELGVFATAPMGIYDDFNSVIHCRPYTVGSYFLAMNEKNIVDTFYREYEISVAQCIKWFGYKNCSDSVQQQWNEGNSENWVSIVHLIEPNDNRDMISPLAKHKSFRAVYYEKNVAKNKDNKFLLESGHDSFPIIAPRWEVTGEDVYGVDCPGITAIGDTKALQLGEKRMYQALDKMLDPPLQGPAVMKDQVGKSLRNGEITWLSGTGEGIKSIYDFRPDLGAIVSINERVIDRINSAFYVDLFLSILNDRRSNITAREIAEKHEEKLLILGPVLERIHTEGLDPIIDITFKKLQSNGVLPEPPDELKGKELNVEYISILAQAQRLVQTGSLERLGGYVGNLSAIWPEARHKFNALQAVDEYASSLGTSPKVIRSDGEVDAIVKSEQAAQAQAASMEQGKALVDTAKVASDTNVSEDNALGAVMRRAGLA